MKIVFLDIDGVLNSHKFLYGKNFGCKPRTEQWLDMLDPEAVAHLNAITEATGAQIVISSSWRIAFWQNFDELCEILRKSGIKADIRARTPSGGDSRGEEIRCWLINQLEFPLTWVILDDDSDMGDLVKYHVKTTFAEGLLSGHVDQAIRILNEAG